MNLPICQKLDKSMLCHCNKDENAKLGIAVLPNLLTAHDKKLIAIKEDVFADDLWIVSYAELRSSKNIRAVIDFIVQELNEFKLIDSL